MHENLGDQLLEMARGARARALLVSPFVKVDALRRITEALPAEVQLTVITRWVPEEIAAGVSDLDVWHTVQSRPSAKLRLLPSLHAKYFRFDDAVAIGSANITGRALGWSPHPNLEVLVQMDGTVFSTFEALLDSRSFEVDAAAYAAMQSVVTGLAARCIPSAGLEVESLSADRSHWFPRSLHVHRLFACYAGEVDTVIHSVYMDGQNDLAALGLPPDLDKPAFDMFVSARLQQLTAVAVVDSAAAKAIDRSAGAKLLINEYGTTAEEALNAWDVLSAWMVHFFPERYRSKSTVNGPALERSQVIR
jgi:hypothetical protein